MSETVGNNLATPFIAMAYGVSLPNTGDINGLAVLSCHQACRFSEHFAVWRVQQCPRPRMLGRA